MKVTVCEAKLLLRRELNDRRIPFVKVTGKTWHFPEMSVPDHVFVTVHGLRWDTPEWNALKEFAQARGFCLGM